MKALKTTGIVLGVILALLLGLYFSGYGQTLFFAATTTWLKPAGDFDPSAAAPAPDYSKDEYWAALPSLDDPADLVPAGVTAIVQGEGMVDSFFIHPTGYLVNKSWTSPLDPNSGTEENTRFMMANQASALNGCCNVYAPRYREATIFSYFVSEEERDVVHDFAYQDVLRAFEYYLEHHNQGRPFVISSHSQGTHHARRLLREKIDATDLHERLVAAYMIGSVIIPLSPAWFDSMDNIRPCQSATDTGCIVHWDTFGDGGAGIEREADSLCTNPLSWRVDDEKADASLNEGAVPPAGTYNVAFGPADDVPSGDTITALDAPSVGHTWAQCRDGTLFVANQTGTAFGGAGAFGDEANYHMLDYSLFHMNIRNNAILRVRTFLAR
jgi:hypothetical protein|tara:strand:- start:866 stop:2014 length:1149 start_codon:yes stop_codon:yes gene_type:complete